MNKSLIDEEGEIWVDIPNYEGIYKISNYGRVKRLIGYKARKCRILSWCYHKKYIMVTLSKNAVHNRIMVHIMVAKLFLTNEYNYPQVLHIDNNPSNPRFDNLKWGTQSMNISEAYEQGRMGGEKSGRAVVNNEIVRQMKEKLNQGVGCRTVAKMFNVSSGCVFSIKQGKTWYKIK